jgi:hypothetical protein
MTTEIIDLKAELERRDEIERQSYEQDRECLRPYYGNRVDTMDYGDLDEFNGMLEMFIEEHGEPVNAGEFLKWVSDEYTRTIQAGRKILGLEEADEYLHTLARKDIEPF